MNDEIKHEIFMMYDLAGDKDLIYYEAIQRIIDYIADLEQENEKLKEENKYLDELRNANYLSWQDSLSRIEKAVEYIRQYDGCITGWYYSKENKRFLAEDNVKDDLLNILNNEE